jgi:hypothetical protein
MRFLPQDFRPFDHRGELTTTPIKPVPPVVPDPDTEHPKPEPQPPIPPPPSIEDPPAPGTGNTPVFTPPAEPPAANARARHLVARYFLGMPVASRGGLG